MSLTIYRTTYSLRTDSTKRIEFFWSQPNNPGRHPVIILIHGHHPGLRIGARNEIASGLFEFFADNGFISVALSQPGYGGSDGPSDYCGPLCQAAVSTVIDYLSAHEHECLDVERIAVLGWSRGGNIAALAACRDPRIKLAILGGALYDLAEGYESLSAGIHKSLSLETDNSREALFERSPIYHVGRLQIPTLIIHGAADDVADPTHARRFYERMVSMQKPVELKMLEKYGHAVPYHVIAEVAAGFLTVNGFSDRFDVPYRLNRHE